MGALDDITGKASDFINQNKDKVNDAIHSDQAEGMSDKVLDGVSGFAKKITGGKFDDQIDNARNAVDDQIGNQ